VKHIQLGKRCFLLVLVLSMFLSPPSVQAQEDSAPTELSLILYADGVVHVDCELETDPILARVNITLIGTTFENLLVKDSEGVLLDYRIFEGYVTVDILGSQSVELDYSTPDLTNKLGSLWSLSLVAPINFNIQLPRGATIIGLSPAPLGIRTLDERASLAMPAGTVAISYMLGVVGTKDHALALRKEAETALEEFQAEGFNITSALTILRQSKEAYDEGQYVQSEELAREVKSWIEETRIAALAADDAIKEAGFAIVAAEDEERTSLLDDARAELEEARQEYASGGYLDAKRLAEQVIITAQLSKTVAWFKSIPVLPLIGTVASAPLIFVYLFRKRRYGPVEVEPVEVRSEPQEVVDVDLDLIFEENRFLRLDDKEVIRFIYESGGGVFASELRERFRLPKSSAWRMIRRLEREEIIETRKVGRETFIEISGRYLLLGTEGVEPSLYHYELENPV
jgi:uncharacterized membrane protein